MSLTQLLSKSTWRCIGTVALLAGTTLAITPPASAQQPSAQRSNGKDEVLAVVNDQTITARHVGNEAMVRYGEEIVDSLVDRYLVLQACQAAKIEITAADVNNEIGRIAKKFGLTTESYLELLETERDITTDQYRSDVIWPMLALRALVADRVKITQEEFNEAFIAEYGESVKCRMIMMVDRTQLEQVLAQARANPETFGQLAAQHSEDEASASVRGLIPPIRHHMGDPALETMAFSLQENEISEPYALGDQWIVLQCVKKLAATPPAEEAFPAIRDQIVDRLRDEKVRSEASVLFNELRSQAQVAKVYGNAELMQQNPGIAAIINQQKLTIAQVTTQALKRHGVEILDGEINRTLLEQALQKANQQVTDADLDAEIARAAMSFGYVDPQGKPDVAGWLAEALQGADQKAIELYKQDAVWPSVALKKLVGDTPVTEEDIQEGYQKNFGPRVEVLAIVLGDQRTAQKVWDLARTNPTDEYFGELAAQFSIEPTSQSNFGKVPPIRQFGGQPTIEKEAFSLNKGDISGIIAAGDKYIVLRCQGRTEPLVSDISAVRDELISEISERNQRLAMAAEFDRLKASAKIYNVLKGAAQEGQAAQQPAQRQQSAQRPGAGVPRR